MRPRRVFALVVLAAAVAAAGANVRWIDAQARAAVVLASVLDTPVVTPAIEAVTREPREIETVVAGSPATLVRPAGDGPWATVVFINGVTRRGRKHPTVRRLARGLARSGHVVLVPDPPGLARGELTPRTLAAVVGAARTAALLPASRGGRVALFGVSAGASLALLAASDRRLVDRVSVVAGVAPYADLVDVVRLASTGYHRDGARLVRYDAEPFVSLVAARSLAAALPSGRDRRSLVAELRRVPDDAEAPLARFRDGRARELGPDGRALVALLANRDAKRFDALFAALPVRVRAASERLSPMRRARRLRAAVELVSAPHDKYFPPAGSRALVRATPDARLTISSTLQHADLDPSLSGLADLAELDAFVVRVLRAARARPT